MSSHDAVRVPVDARGERMDVPGVRPLRQVLPGGGLSWMIYTEPGNCSIARCGASPSV